MSDVKIQLNSLEALERLLGGDTQLEVDIRRNIAEEFAKKYLKTLYNDQMAHIAHNGITDAMKKEIYEDVKSPGSSYYTNVQLRPDVKAKIQEYVESKLKDMIYEAVDEKIKATGIYDKIEAYVQRGSDSILNAMTDANLEYRINALAEKKIKEKLGIK